MAGRTRHKQVEVSKFESHRMPLHRHLPMILSSSFHSLKVKHCIYLHPALTWRIAYLISSDALLLVREWFIRVCSAV